MNLELRDAIEADLPILYEHQRDPEGVRMAAFPARDWDAFSAHWEKISGDERAIRKVILVEGRVAGSIGSWENEEGARFVGYVLGREHWGRGIASAALARFLELVKPRPLHAFVAKHNIGSIRVLEKNGFTLVSEQTSHDHDMVVDELLMTLD